MGASGICVARARPIADVASGRAGGLRQSEAGEALMGDESCVAAAVREGVEAWKKG